MIPDSEKTSIITALRRGRYSLLLGAGFSADSTDSSGEKLPLGERLKNEIAQLFSLPDYYPLATLAGAAPQDQLSIFFEKRFKNCKASLGASFVSNFVWKSIYTFNIDDILVDAYRHPNAKQTPKFLTHKHDYYSPRDPGELLVIHLHGSVQKPEHGYVFSMREYGTLSAQDSTWFKIATDEIVASPFIVIGFGMYEPDLEYYLARRQGLPVDSQQVAPSIYVTDKLDAVKLQACKRFGLLPVEVSASNFFATLLNEAAPIPTPSELLLPILQGSLSWAKRAPDAHARMFFRQWLQVVPNELPEAPPSAETTHLLQGVEPRWHHIKEGNDVIRTAERSLVQKISHWASSSDGTDQTVLVTADPGEGKSTALKRIAFELAQSSILVFFFNVAERLLVESSFAVLKEISTPVVLVVDQVAEHGHQFLELMSQLRADKRRVFAIVAERTHRLYKVTDSLSSLDYEEQHLRHLNNAEALTLSVKLREAGLLGRNSRFSDQEVASKLTQKSLFVSLVILNRDTPQLRNVIDSELQEFSPEARLLYAIFCLAHACGYPLKMSLAQRASGIESGVLNQLFKTTLRGLLKGLPPAGEYRETRHRIIAEEVIKSIPLAERFDVSVRLAQSLAPYVNTKTVTDGTPEARLSARLLNYDDMVEPLVEKRATEFYDKIKPSWGWNSRYWDQVALMKLGRDPITALKHAEQAVAIDLHPVPLTTLSKIRFRLAKTHAGTSHGIRYLNEAIGSIKEAIRLSGKRQRREIQPFDVGIRGIVDYYRVDLKKGQLELDPKIREAGDEFVTTAKRWFREKPLVGLINEWNQLKADAIR